MKIIKLDKGSVDKWIEQLEDLVYNGEIYEDITSGTVKEVINGRIHIYLAINNDDDILGWAEVSTYLDKPELLALENFTGVKGVGTNIINAIKKDFNSFKVISVEEVTGFYLKQGLKFVKNNDLGDLLIWEGTNESN